MRLRFLGTGTSTGVPAIRCNCEVCMSHDVHDHRSRASAIISTGKSNILIDCGPDFRQQILSAGSPDLAAALLTHSHYDHVGGIDDLRPYCFATDNGFRLYCQDDVEQDLRQRMPYCFREHLYPGVPTFEFHTLTAGQTVSIDGINVLPLRVNHGKIPILGFKIGNMAYITDALTLPEDTYSALQGIDTLVINALRHTSHYSHMTLTEALHAIDRIKPRIAYLTHIADSMGLHETTSRSLPQNVFIAYDNLEIIIPD